MNKFVKAIALLLSRKKKSNERIDGEMNYKSTKRVDGEFNHNCNIRVDGIGIWVQEMVGRTCNHPLRPSVHSGASLGCHNSGIWLWFDELEF